MNIEFLFQSDSFRSLCKWKIGIGSGLLFASILAVAAQPVLLTPPPNPPPVELPTPVNVVYTFSPATNYVPFLGYTNWDGAFCNASLIEGYDGKLYGVAPSGGEFGGGTVFSLNTDGNEFRVLHTFTGLAGRAALSNEGGNKPTGLMLGLDGKLYGTTSLGGRNGFGAIFTLSCDGNCFTNLHSFTTNDGEYPQGGLVQGQDGTLYGTARDGGTNGSGTVFSLQPDGSDFTVLYNFTPVISGTNADGANPYGGLILSSDGTLYGSARYAGPTGSTRTFVQAPIGSGTIFSLRTNGDSFTVLHSFDKFSELGLSPTNKDGASSYSALLLGTDGKLYGTAPEAGPGSGGTVFCLCTNGNNYTVLQSFYVLPLSFYFKTSTGYGLYPYGGLIQGNDGILYGAAYGGGLDGTFFAGTLYRLNPDGSGLAVLHTFAGLDYNTNADGANSFTTLLKASDGKFYGLTSAGGTNGSGTIFSFVPPVVLQVAALNGCAILIWPASATNYVLETCDTLCGNPAWTPLTNNISTVSNNFTLPVSATSGAAFFRLHQP